MTRASASYAVAQPAGASDRVEENVATHVRLVQRAVASGARLVLFPELSLTGYHLRHRPEDAIEVDDERLAPLRALASARDVAIVAGAPLRSRRGLHIGALRFDASGSVTTYVKRHLGGEEPRAFVPGEGGAPIVVGEDLVACAICAEVNHPEHAAAAARGGASVYAAGCLLDADGYARDEARLATHARSHRLVVLMANYAPPVPEWRAAGRSAIWSETGDRVVVAPADREAVLVAARAAGGAWTSQVHV